MRELDPFAVDKQSTDLKTGVGRTLVSVYTRLEIGYAALNTFERFKMVI